MGYIMELLLFFFLKKKKLILFALSITFLDKNLTQKHVACVVKNCLTWDRKSVCQFEQLMVSLILYTTTSIKPALNLFCSAYTSVMHLTPCASFQHWKILKKTLFFF